MKDKRIDEITVEGTTIYGDKEGYIYLNRGYRFGDTGNPNNQQHGTGYLGDAEIKERMKDIKKCSCHWCKGEEN